MMLWGNLVPQMVVFRLPMVHCLRGIMIQIIVSFLKQRMRRILCAFLRERRLNIDVTPWAFDLGFLTNGFLQANDTMQGVLAKDVVPCCMC